MATQEELRLQAIRSQGNAEPDPAFMAGPNTVQAPAKPAYSQSDRAFAIDLLRNDSSLSEVQQAKLMDGIDAFDQRGSPSSFEGKILTGSLPTGIDSIDGVNLPARARGAVSNEAYRELQNTALLRRLDGAPESDEALLYESAQAGVENRIGVGFNRSFQQVVNAPTPSIQAEVFAETMAKISAQLPDGSPMIRQSLKTGDVEYLRPVTEDDVRNGLEAEGSVGSFRWTSAKSAGIGPDDWAKLFNMSEIGSLVGGVGGAVATRNLTFFKQAGATGNLAKRGFRESGFGARRGATGVAGETTAGLVGREVGNLIRLGVSAAQGRDIDWVEYLQQIPSDAGRELVAAIGGRAAGKALEKLKAGVVKGKARLQGLRVVDGTAEGAAARQASERSASEDLAVTNAELKALGREEQLTISRAESETTVNQKLDDEGNLIGDLGARDQSGQGARINEEESRRINAGQANRDLTISRDTENMAVARVLANKERDAAGGKAFNADEANRIVQDAETIRISGVADEPTRGRIHPDGVPMDPGGARSGIIFEVKPDSIDVVSAGLPVGVRKVGLGGDMYRELLAFGKAEGKTVNSGSQVTVDADNMWRLMIQEGHKVKRSPKAAPVHGEDGQILGFGTGDPNVPVYSLVAPPPFINSVVATAQRARSPAGSQASRERAQAETDRLFRHSTATQRGTIKTEAAQNYPRKVDIVEELFNHYDRAVNSTVVGGRRRYNAQAAEKWYDDTSDLLEAVLSPEEFMRVRGGPPGAFREVFNEMASSRNDMITGLGNILKTGGTAIFKDNKALISQLKAAPAPARRRALALIEHTAPEMYESMQAEVRRNVGKHMFAPVKGKTVGKGAQATFGEWLAKNTKMLNDMFPDSAVERASRGGGNSQYVEDLHRFNRQLSRLSSREGARATKRVVNTPLLQMSRTVMGVMNKWQRRVTAGRKIQMQRWYGRIVDLVEDPKKLRELVAFSELQPRLGNNAAVASQAAVRLGIVANQEEYEEFSRAVGQWMTWDLAEKEK